MYKEIYHTFAPWVQTLLLGILSSSIILLYMSQIRFLFTRSRWNFSGKRLPPGPKPWPLIGNLPSLGTNPHEACFNLAKIYGPVMSLQMGTRPTLVLSSSTMAREILKTHDKCFGFRPASVLYETLQGKDAYVESFFNDGGLYKGVKKLITLDLMSNRPMENTKAGRTEEILLGLRALVESAEKSRQDGNDVCEIVFQYFLQIGGNVVTRAIFGQRLFTTSYSNYESNVFAKTVVQEVALLVGYDIRDAFPFFKNLDIQGKSKRLRALKAKLWKIVHPYVDARKDQKLHKSSKSENEKDFLDVLHAYESRGETMPDYMKTEVILALLDGVVAMSTVLEWAMSELLRKPEAMNKCREQLDAVVGQDRLVSESDLPQLPFIRAILLESMRLHATCAFMIPRESQSDCEVGGYFVPAKTLTLLNVRAINRDPATWSDPHEFIPDRHFKSPGGDVDVNLEDFTLLTFGSGRRSCPGRKLGWHMIQMKLATFLHALDFELAGGLKPEQLNMNARRMRLDGLREEPLKLVPTPRIPRSIIFGT